jgi:hypothetical protein
VFAARQPVPGAVSGNLATVSEVIDEVADVQTERPAASQQADQGVEQVVRRALRGIVGRFRLGA